MNKEECINKLADATQTTTKEASQFLNAFMQILTDALVQEDIVRLSGFGNFSIKIRAARTGRNPRTGEPLDIPETRLVHFSPAKVLKDSLNTSTPKNSGTAT